MSVGSVESNADDHLGKLIHQAHQKSRKLNRSLITMLLRSGRAWVFFFGRNGLAPWLTPCDQDGNKPPSKLTHKHYPSHGVGDLPVFSSVIIFRPRTRYVINKHTWHLWSCFWHRDMRRTLLMNRVQIYRSGVRYCLLTSYTHQSVWMIIGKHWLSTKTYLEKYFVRTVMKTNNGVRHKPTQGCARMHCCDCGKQRREKRLTLWNRPTEVKMDDLTRPFNR